MPHRDPKNRPYRIAVYIAYGFIVAWVVVPFVVGGGRGVYSREGLDRLAASRAAGALCAAAAAATPAIRIDGCPAVAAAGSPDLPLAEAKVHVAEIVDRGIKDRLRRAVAGVEVLIKGAHDPAAARRVAGDLADFL